MSKNKYALILTYNSAYFLALVALLNSLDYYNNDNLDVHIIYDPDIEAQVEILKNSNFCFNIITYNISNIYNSNYDPVINYMFCKYKYVQTLKEDYDAICYFDGDNLPLCNLTQYFEIASKTGYIVCPSFPYTPITIEFFKNSDPDWVCKLLPLFNHPVWYNPKLHNDVMEKMFSYLPSRDNLDRDRNHECYFFNKVLWELNKLDQVFVISGSYWVADRITSVDTLFLDTRGPKLAIFTTTTFERINLIHNKYWKLGVAPTISRDCGDSTAGQCMCQNIITIQNMLKFFNTQCKVKFREIPNNMSEYFDENAF